MDWLKKYWTIAAYILGALGVSYTGAVGVGDFMAKAEASHEKTKENAEVSRRSIEAVEQLRAQNQLQSLTLRLLCQEETHKAESVCRAIEAQDRARAAAAKAASEAAVR